MRLIRRLSIPLALALVACTTAGARAHQAPAPIRPNIVFVLTDDLSWNLVQYMPHVQQLEREGMTFTNFTVTDSLCCPSRTSIFTGEYPHNHGVLFNGGKRGGWHRFLAEHDGAKSFAVPLQASGYTTSLIVKYQNKYDPSESATPPQGWSTWHAADDHSYGGYDYSEADNGTVRHYGTAPDDYTTTNFADHAQAFLDAHSSPLFLELASYAPHSSHAGLDAIPAPQDENAYPDLTAPSGGAFDQPVAHPPTWLANVPPLTDAQIAADNAGFVDRVRAVLGVDRAIGE